MPDTGAEAEIREHLKVRAIDITPIGIVISDATQPDNPLIYANDAFQRITGCSRDEIIGRNCRFLQGRETHETPVVSLRAGIDRGEVTRVELLNYRADGNAFWNEVTVAPISDPDGTITNYVGFQVDVTDRKRAEREREERTVNSSSWSPAFTGSCRTSPRC